jgi:hypothetical protein
MIIPWTPFLSGVRGGSAVPTGASLSSAVTADRLEADGPSHRRTRTGLLPM